MSPSQPAPCTHDRGPGTTVCLRCRHDQVKASQHRRQRFLMQFLGLASAAALIGFVGVGFASTLRGPRQPDVTTTSEGNVTSTEKQKRPATSSKIVDAAPIVVQQSQ